MKRDPAKRRYRDRWERAIAALEKAAHGRDIGAALLDAARGRYALYRFSQVEADRAAALALARRAERAGARDAAAFRTAVRNEMGEQGPPPATASAPPRRRGDSRVVATAPSTAAPAKPRRDEPERERPAPASPRIAAASPPPPPVVEAPRTAAPRAPRPESEDEEPSTDAILEQAIRDDEAPDRPAAAQAAAEISDLKTWSNGDYTRLAIYLSRPAEFRRVDDLPAQAGAARRIAVDVTPAVVTRELAREVRDGLVKSVRVTQVDPATARVVLELTRDEELTVFPLDEPARLIVDVGAARPPAAHVASSPGPAAGGSSTADATSRDTAPGPRGAPVARRAEAGAGEEHSGPERRIRRIIVDAGHGGYDTGAIGPTGVREKDVTLAMARRLEARLRAHGYEVVLTRPDDRYVPLEERTAVANARHGDLFVSLHANAHPRRDRRGVETYVLDVNSDRYAGRLAARENGALRDGAADIPLLRRILSDLEAKASVEESRRVATAVQRELCSGIRTQFGDVRDLGVKSALFHVLLGARMPAVLVEAAFISNPVEERRLGRSAFHDEVASAVVRAIERVAAAEARVASVR